MGLFDFLNKKNKDVEKNKIVTENNNTDTGDSVAAGSVDEQIDIIKTKIQKPGDSSDVPNDASSSASAEKPSNDDDFFINELKKLNDVESFEEIGEYELIASMAGNIDNLSDDEIERLLSGIADSDDSKYNYIKDETVIEEPIGEQDEQAEPEVPMPVKVEKPKRKAKKKREPIKIELNPKKAFNAMLDMPIKTLLTIVGVLTVIVLVVCAVLWLQVQKKYELEQEVNSRVARVKPPEYISNTANYIYISKEGMLDDERVTLTRILASPVKTMFYFDTYSDLSFYDAVLTDDLGNFFHPDLAFYGDIDRSTKGSVLHFEPLRKDTEWVKLKLTNPLTSESLSFDVKFEKGMQDIPVKYLQEERYAHTPTSDYTVKINKGVFTSTGSEIDYVIKWSDEDLAIRHGQSKEDNNVYISLIEGAKSVMKQKQAPSATKFQDDNIIVGKMYFDSVRNLSSTVEVIFKDLYRESKINRDVPVAQLFNYNMEGNEIVIDVAPYKVVLEGLKQFGDEIFVLTYYVEDTRVFAKTEGSVALDNRVEAQVIGNLVATNSDGVEIMLNGECMSRQQGGDIRFPLKGSGDLFKGIPNENYSLEISSVAIKLKDVVIPIDLSQLPDEKEVTQNSIAEDAIVEAFTKRIDMKINNLEKQTLDGYFSDSVLNSGTMLDYTTGEIFDNCNYMAQIISMDIENDTIYAYVAENMNGEKDLHEVTFYRAHKVIAKKQNDSFIIVDDVIIR